MLTIKPKAGRPSARKDRSFVVATVGEVASFFGVSVAAVNKWIAEADPMPGKRGAYDLSQIVQWKIRRAPAKTVAADELKAADIRLKTAQAEAKEMDNERVRGNLVSVDDVDRWAATILIELRESLMQLPERVATSSPPDIREFMREESDRHVRESIIAAQRKIERHDYIEEEPEE